MMHGLRHFLLALQFFTRVPVTGRLAAWVGFSPAMLRASAAHFPGVGWLVGAVGAGVFLLAQAGLPGMGGAVAAGLADVADGLGGSADRTRALQIMKDSRIGAFGALALALALGLKVALLATLAGQGAMNVATALLAAHVLSRLAPLFLIRWLPYVGDDGSTSKSKPLADAIGGGALLVGVLYALPAVLLLLFTHPLAQAVAALVACALAASYMARLLARRLQGFTGDGLGATQQLCELALYLALAWQA
jgi:adenosylcobinamide-GDP ribazoletransferase